MTDMLDMAAVAKVAEAAVDAAAGGIRQHFRSSLDTLDKDDASPVTIADRGAEVILRKILQEAYPEFGLIGEEFGTINPEARYRWVVDPIDGTRAFITGRPLFGTLVALLDGDQPILGVIDQPILGERWIGIRGQKTVFKGPFGGIAGTRPCDSLARAEMSCTAPDMVSGDAAPHFEKLATTVRRLSWGGDCYAYGLLALGQIDIVAEGDLKIWDWAALQPIIEGAGGAITDWEGLPLRADGDGRALAVGDPALLQPAVDALRWSARTAKQSAA